MKRYINIFVLVLAIVACFAGCASVETGKNGEEANRVGTEASGDESTSTGAVTSEVSNEDSIEASVAATEANEEEAKKQVTETAVSEDKKETAETSIGKTEGASSETADIQGIEADTAAEESETVIKDMAAIMEEYNAQLDLEDNPFWDSLVYTGYNIEKHYADGLMWHYVLAANKRGKGWLSDITYAGGSLGYETTEDGLPDIEFFEDYGLVCASYVTYVYFNYLPNVAGIDTSVLTRPEKSYSANDWYIAAKDWVEKGYSKNIDFEASLTGAGFIDFDTLEEMPVGSIIAFCDSRNKSDYCSHVVIYAGYQNDYHWVYHVGNENGPEFCSVQRMHFGPDPQWPIAVITTPDFVMEAITESFPVTD